MQLVHRNGSLVFERPAGKLREDVFSIVVIPFFLQINLKGLDGVQGPVYVGTGCVFRRQALYGVDPPLSDKPPNDDFITHFCCGPRKKSKVGRSKNVERKTGRSDSSVPMFNMEDIEEGVEGMLP